MLHDLIIIGAGPAGLSAALYAARKKINALILTDGASGQTVEAHLVENYLGIPSVPGNELLEKLKWHTKNTGIEIKDGVDIVKVESAGKTFKILAHNDVFSAKTIIVAAGKKYRELEIPGAKEFAGKGITYCATCDAPLFKNKVVAVVGGGDAGQDAAWQLTQYASKIYLLNKYPELMGDDLRVQEKLNNHSRVEILNNCEPIEIKGDKFVKSLFIKQNGNVETRELAVDGIFV